LGLRHTRADSEALEYRDPVRRVGSPRCPVRGGSAFLAGPLAGVAGRRLPDREHAGVRSSSSPMRSAFGHTIGDGLGVSVEQIRQMSRVLGYSTLGAGVVALSLLRRGRARGELGTRPPSLPWVSARHRVELRGSARASSVASSPRCPTWRPTVPRMGPSAECSTRGTSAGTRTPRRSTPIAGSDRFGRPMPRWSTSS
jgi:hypothetical protein